MLDIKRELKLPREANLFLFGPRQVGKSTLLRETFPLSSSLHYNLLIDKEFTRLASQT